MGVAEFSVRIGVRAPILTAGTAMAGFGLDEAVARDSDGVPVIPGSHVAGKFAEALATLMPFAPTTKQISIADWLGTADVKAGLARKRLTFSDFRPASEFKEANKGQRIRIKMNKETGTVEKGALLVMESPFPTGKTIVFEGTARFAGTDKEFENVAFWLTKGLNWISQLGGQRTVGFGRVMEVEVTRNNTTERKTPLDATLVAAIETDGRLEMTLTFTDPFCIARPPTGRNGFESDSCVPGGVVKGAMAALWAATSGRSSGAEVSAEAGGPYDALANHFHLIRFSHLFPALKASGKDASVSRPQRWPQSLVAVGKGKDLELFDVARQSGAGLIDDLCPSFPVDWKTEAFGKADALTGWSDPPRQLRVRTAMDSDSRRAANEQLFSLELVEVSRHLWRGWLDLRNIPDILDRRKAFEELADLLADGLPGIGKTKATARIHFAVPSSEPAKSDLDPVDGEWILTLQTPALLCDPAEVRESGLFAAYRQYWESLSEGALTLRRHFARQSLSGGEYLMRRYLGGGRRPYQPYYLTDPGSVFVLAPEPGKEGEARRVIGAWRDNGLPLSSPIKKAYGMGEGPEWRECPYIRENGYGEISVNLALHFDRDPKTRFEAVEDLT